MQTHVHTPHTGDNVHFVGVTHVHTAVLVLKVSVLYRRRWSCMYVYGYVYGYVYVYVCMY